MDGTLTVIAPDRGHIYVWFDTDGYGEVAIELPPGTYRLRVDCCDGPVLDAGTFTVTAT